MTILRSVYRYTSITAIWTVCCVCTSANSLRFATFNSSLNQCDDRTSPCLSGGVEQLLTDPEFVQGRQVAEIIERVDYVLPSSNLETESVGIFWPETRDPLARLLRASDHRLVWADIQIPSVPAPAGLTMAFVGFLIAIGSACGYDRKRYGKLF